MIAWWSLLTNLDTSGHHVYTGEFSDTSYIRTSKMTSLPCIPKVTRFFRPHGSGYPDAFGCSRSKWLQHLHFMRELLSCEFIQTDLKCNYDNCLSAGHRRFRKNRFSQFDDRYGKGMEWNFGAKLQEDRMVSLAPGGKDVPLQGDLVLFQIQKGWHCWLVSFPERSECWICWVVKLKKLMTKYVNYV